MLTSQVRKEAQVGDINEKDVEIKEHEINQSADR